MLSTEIPWSGTATAREELRLLLRERAILYEGPEQPVLGRDGASAPWMFYSWGISLTANGARLAAECFLERLRGFESTQIATFGYTGMPLLSACVLLGGGRYTGLCIREKRKAYGSCRHIEGNIDRTRPVVVLDDSLSSGTSMRKAIQALEEEGLQVEGGVALVYFPYRGGAERALGLGYRVEWIFDVWKDLEMPRPVYTPGFRRASPERWGSQKIADGLHPAVAARRVAEIYLDCGEVPLPPASFDPPVDGRGGVYVSFREPASEKRLAREGFWHFDAADADPCRDLVLATVKTLRLAEVPIPRERLDGLKIAVSFLGPLERIQPRQLDYWRHGIVVHSRAWPTKVGGALPNTQVFTHELEQYRHARFTNADLTLFEPHDLYRHEVAKYVEPGAGWLPFGATEDEGDWTRDDAVGRRLTARVRELLAAAISGEAAAGTPVEDDLVPAPVYAAGVTLYHRGVGGCMLSWSGSLDDCLARATRGALNDRRFGERLTGVAAGEIDLVVSILHDREWVGNLPTANVARKLRLGLDSLAVQQGDRCALFLPSVATDYNWTKEKVVAELMRKAGIAGPPCYWATFRTAVWVGPHDGPARRLWFGFPVRGERSRNAEEIRADVALLADYLLRSRGPDGLPEYEYLPIEGRRTREGTAARVVHALAALDEAGRFLKDADLSSAAREGLRFCAAHLGGPAGDTLELPGLGSGPMATATLLEALAASGDATLLPPAAPLAARLLGLFRPDGRIAERLTGPADHDFLPGAVLLALALYWEATSEPLTGEHSERLDRAFAWYRRRFRMLQPWGMVGWQTRAWAAVHRLTRNPEHAAFVFEAADWSLDWQHERTGAFITDLHSAGPSFHTAFLIEGITDAWALARELGEGRRAAVYERSWQEAVRFLDQLVIRPEDTFCMADAARAVGGVRSSRANSDVRIDFVSHTLLALLEGARLSRKETPS
ncbi:MAG TPA: AMMECR1 domain-containing protein [Thermoanaerobaculia bacterium]|nr:AMMECR1 domain-containing protein [Thermoanaerobaculia bacterium]